MQHSSTVSSGVKHACNRLPTLPSVTGLLRRRETDSEDSRVGCNARVQDEKHTEPQSSAGPTLQDSELIATTGNTLSPPLEETDPRCSGAMTLNSCDVLVEQ